MNFVATSSDVLPSYAALLPITLKIWKHYGYEAIVVLHDDPRWVSTEFGRLIYQELEGSNIIWLPTCSPLSIPNTMRVGRMTAATLPLHPEDIIVYSDADYWPLADCMCPPNPPTLGHLNLYWPIVNAEKQLVAGTHHFGFQHSCQSVEIAREILPIVIGDPEATMKGFDVVRDDIDLDQGTWGWRVLTSPRVKLTERFDAHNVCWFGELELRSWPDAPQYYTGVHPGTIIHHADDLTRVDEALNFIPVHCNPHKGAWPRTEVLRQRHPWIVPWLDAYWAQAAPAAERFPWPS